MEILLSCTKPSWKDWWCCHSNDSFIVSTNHAPDSKEGMKKSLSLRFSLNTLMPWDALMRQWAGSILVQIMAYRLLATKPSSDIMFNNGHRCPDKQTLVKFESKYKNLFLNKMHLTVSCEKKCRRFCFFLHVFTQLTWVITLEWRTRLTTLLPVRITLRSID